MATEPNAIDTNILPKSPPPQSIHLETKPTPSSTLPPVTYPTDAQSIARAAALISIANLSDPLNTIFSLEETAASTASITSDIAATPESDTPSSTIISSPLPSSDTTLYRARTHRRLHTKLSHGAQLVESANFAAVAVWESPDAVKSLTSSPDSDSGGTSTSASSLHLPVFESYIEKVRAHRARTFPAGQRYYKLTMMARDPQRRDRGAVRVLIEPLVARARREGVPVWCEAGNERARDVYSWMGFETKGMVRTGVGIYDEMGREDEKGEGVRTWCMVANWPVEVVDSAGRDMERN